MNTKTIKFDLNKYKLYEKIKAKQGDTKSRFLLFQLLDGSIPFNLKNRSVRAYMVKPDGREIFNDLIVNNYNLGYCTLELTNQVLAVPGTVKIELMVTEEEKKLTSSVFELEVVKSINSEKSIVSTNEFTALLNGLAALSEYDNYKNAVKEMEINKADKAKVEEKFGEVYEQLDTKTTEINKFKDSLNTGDLTFKGCNFYLPYNSSEFGNMNYLIDKVWC
ncbi:MAG: BppU family phage baseplate upper protein [Clostridium sp.]|uniref:BppU family phage baseplate upper protein n=1 Tax=Clostridium sp. TaxID=1506 RepID=UPI0025C39DE3|nr:BppU family phage baseplate upper protein [Clostridium sp.]MBS4957968.1 BppU family phage baseplate upper protein [Clostridium sp.]